MRAAAPRNGVRFSAAAGALVGAAAGAGDACGAAAGAGAGAVAGALTGAVPFGVATPDDPGRYPRKKSFHDSLTEFGSRRNCSYISSMSHALGPTAAAEKGASDTRSEPTHLNSVRWPSKGISPEVFLGPIDSGAVRIATWNVNSLKARLPRVEVWLAEAAPDVLCMQETKMANDAFPHAEFEKWGYETVHFGEGRWNGVAIASKVGIANVAPGWSDGGPEDPEARLLWADCGDVRVASVYVPNGRSLDNPHYTYKLGWLARLRSHLENAEDASTRLAICGDFNICPDDRDVWSPKEWEGNTHVSQPERDALTELTSWGLRDVFRDHHDESGVFSFWDYRGGDFHKGRGLRIDFIMATNSLADSCTSAVIDRDARKNGPNGEKPSDHAPVVAEFS